TGSFTAADKVYDGNTDATITSASLDGTVKDDKVSLVGGAAQFETKAAGKNRPVTGSGFALAGDDKADYSLKSSSLGTTATITAKELTGSFAAGDKVYDGNRDATITGRSLSGVVGSEEVSLTGGSALCGTKDVGKDKTVSGTAFGLGCDDKDNYVLDSVAD